MMDEWMERRWKQLRADIIERLQSQGRRAGGIRGRRALRLEIEVDGARLVERGWRKEGTEDWSGAGYWRGKR